MNHRVIELDGHGSLEVEVKEGIIYLNGQHVCRRTMSAIYEASHLAIITSDLQLAEIRRKERVQ